MIDADADKPCVNPNTGFLEGKRCPQCGSYGALEVLVLKRVRMYDNGTDDAEDGSCEFDDDSPATCCRCGHEAKLGDFDE